MTEVVNINPTKWCAFCCSNTCYCSKDSLLRQLANALPTIKERNEEIIKLETRIERLRAALDDNRSLTPELAKNGDIIECEEGDE